MFIQEKELTEKLTKETTAMILNTALTQIAEVEAEKEKINNLLVQAENLAKKSNPNKGQIYDLRRQAMTLINKYFSEPVDPKNVAS